MKRMLIADNNPRDHERYRKFFAECELAIHSTGCEAIKCFRTAARAVDLAIVQWDLDGTPNGPETIVQLRRESEHLPIIAVGGDLDLERATTAKALGAADFLLKPLERRDLLAAVQALLSPKTTSPLLAELEQRVIGQSAALLGALECLADVIPASDANLLLTGECGTGKELLARAIHDLSDRSSEPWTPVNVAAIPETLLESHLFGSEEGAFTDAKAHIGYFEECGAGTLFLDEIGELPLVLQAKLLRAVEERTFRRVGGKQQLPFEGRLVCATNRDLVAADKAGEFRKDLYFRIGTHEIHIPPLRERGDDLWLLIDHFLEKYGGKRNVRLRREAKSLLSGYDYNGNIRELEDIIKEAIVRCHGDEISPYDLPVGTMRKWESCSGSNQQGSNILWPPHLYQLPQQEAAKEIERMFNREYLELKLREADGVLTRAAKAADLDPKTFRRKRDEAGLPDSHSSKCCQSARISARDHRDP